MAVHVPLSQAAQDEAKSMMLSTANLFVAGRRVAGGRAHAGHGCWGVLLPDRSIAPLGEGKKRRLFAGEDEAILAYQLRTITLHEPYGRRFGRGISRPSGSFRAAQRPPSGESSSPVLPPQLRFNNDVMKRSALKELVDECLPAPRARGDGAPG